MDGIWRVDIEREIQGVPIAGLSWSKLWGV